MKGAIVMIGITIAMLAVYIAVMLGIGIYTSKRTKSVSDFVLGGRGVGSWLTAFAYGTSYFSAVVFIGYAGQFGWSYGISAAWIGIGNAILGSALAWIVLGKRTRMMTKHLNAKTMPEYFEKRFDSKGLKIAAAIIVFVFLIPYTASVYNGLSRLFAMALGLESELSYKMIIVAMALITAIYVLLGGYAAAALNHSVHGVVKLVGIADRYMHKPEEMSGGQQQRVGIARALITDPSIIFADEPTGNLDSNTTREVMQMIRNIVNERHNTVIMVTHDINVAQYADTIVKISDGKVVSVSKNDMNGDSKNEKD